MNWALFIYFELSALFLLLAFVSLYKMKSEARFVISPLCWMVCIVFYGMAIHEKGWL